MDGDAAGDGGFHVDGGAVGCGEVEEGCAFEGHEFLVRGDDGLAGFEGGLDDFERGGGATDEFAEDVDIFGVGDIAPVARDPRGGRNVRNIFGENVLAGDSGNDEGEAEFCLELGGIARENFEGAGADVTGADDAYANGSHKL